MFVAFKYQNRHPIVIGCEAGHKREPKQSYAINSLILFRKAMPVVLRLYQSRPLLNPDR